MKSDNETNYLFITGMFRSGTTLLGRMLDSHKNITIASDSCMALLKNFRTDIAKTINLNITSEKPLDDYYFSENKIKLKKTIQNCDIDYKIDKEEFIEKRENIIKETKSHSSPYCPKIVEIIDELEGNSYKEMLISFLKIIQKQYGPKNTKIVGFKDVWTDEFIKPISKSLTNMKFIQILRDPRAVCASKKKQIEQYPWLFLIRQWRKLAAYAWNYQNDPLLKGKVLLVYYEDLILHPEETSRKICDFLGMEFDYDMIKPEKYTDGQGRLWKQNTSYEESKKGFNTDSITKWKNILSEEEIDLIEILSGFEMNLHGYNIKEKNKIKKIPFKHIIDAPRVKNNYLASWIKNLVQNTPLHTHLEMLKEQSRFELIYGDYENRSEIDLNIIESSFLFKKLYNHLRGIKNE